jgi:2-polyprenyl-6-methoxyphenol hydroxylase-like FAD-dependent oxidoreductase
MSKILSTTVFVVGSGPIGLWLAYELRRAGLDVLVIDTLPSREARCPYSKALSMSAGTLETFESRRIAKYFLSSGMPLPRTHFGGLPTLLELNYEVLGVQHCHNLVIPQSRTETILLDRCDEVGVRFAWGMEFEDLK